MVSSRDEGGWREDRGQRFMHDDNRSDSYGPRSRSGASSSERGFFERAGDEISSWFGDDEAERRREMDERSSGRGQGGRSDYRDEPRGHDRPPHREQRPGEFAGREAGRDQYRRSGPDRAQSRFFGGDRPRERDDAPAGDGRPYMGRTPEFRDMGRPERSRDMSREQSNYRPLTGDYGRSAEERESSNYAPSGPSVGVTSAHDRHYSEWRQRQIDQLDRDYEEYRREHQSKFESDFSNWRSSRQSKRQMLSSVREHMQVVGADDQPLGTVDKVRGDKLILTKADSPDGQHHSLACTMIDRVEGDRVILDKKADEARAMFGNEEGERASADQGGDGGPGPHILNRSFSGTY